MTLPVTRAFFGFRLEWHPEAYGASTVSVKTLMSFKRYSHARRPNYQLE